MKHTENSNIDGILVLCSCLDSALWTLSNQRYERRHILRDEFSFSGKNTSLTALYRAHPSKFSSILSIHGLGLSFSCG